MKKILICLLGSFLLCSCVKNTEPVQFEEKEFVSWLKRNGNYKKFKTKEEAKKRYFEESNLRSKEEDWKKYKYDNHVIEY